MHKYPLYSTSRIDDLQQLVQRCAAAFGERDAFRVRKSRQEFLSISYTRFYRDLCALGNALLREGFAGKRIAVTGENSYEWVLVYLAAVNCNATIVPLDKELSGSRMRELARRAGVSLFFYSDTYRDEACAVESGLDGCSFVNLGSGAPPASHRTLEEFLRAGGEAGEPPTPFERLEIDRERPCVLLFTSGTTGESKGVLLCHRNLSADVTAACQMVGFEAGERVLSVLPAHHAYEATCGILSMLHYGVTICFNDGLKNLSANLQLFRPTGMFLVPLFLETFYRKIWDTVRRDGREKAVRRAIALTAVPERLGIPVRRRVFREVHAVFGGELRKIVCGGAYLDPALSRGFRELGIPVLQGYGITECSPLVAVNRNGFYRAEAAGLPIPCCQVRVDAPAGQAGEVLVRGDNVMLGYLAEPELTAEALRDGWFHTGDIGRLDRRGFLYITGRCKNVIVLKNGENVQPEELEALLREDAHVGEAVVTEALTDANGAGGLRALIYPDPAACAGMSGEEVAAALRQAVDAANRELPPGKKLSGFEVREQEFPKNSTHKIMRHKIQRLP